MTPPDNMPRRAGSITVGRYLVLAMITVFFAVEGVTFLMGQGHIVRLILTALLSYFVYAGSRWAYLLMILLLVAATAIAVILGMTSGKPAVLLVAAPFTIAAAVLIYSPSVKAFLDHQAHPAEETELRYGIADPEADSEREG